MQTKRIFLASSAELAEDRKEFEIFISRKNTDWVDQGVYIERIVWEDFLDAVSKTRLQDEYNKAIRECDVFVMLFSTKVGKYTEEEFETAFGQFKATNKPFIFTYFKDTAISTASADKKDLMSLWAFQEKLGALGHFYTVYKNTDELRLHFNLQLDKLVKNGFIQLRTGAYDPEDLTAYLRFVVQTNSVLDLRGLTGTGQNVAVPLEEVYVSLHAEVDNPVEREYDRGVLEQDVLELAERLHVRELTERQRRELRYRILVRESQITRARDQSEDLEVSAVIRRSRCAVVLGDPGSGKSTVLRHVALTFARSLLTVQERTMTPHIAAHAVPGGDESSDLESVRLPILVGISAFADARQRNPDLQLEDFLGAYFHAQGLLTEPMRLQALLKDHLERQACIILLDGLDEVSNWQERQEVVRSIESFISRYLREPESSREPKSDWAGDIPPLHDDPKSDPLSSVRRFSAVNREPLWPAGTGGNQIFITSRVAGYRAVPLRGDIAHYTISEMSDSAIKRFLGRWFYAVGRAVQREDLGDHAIRERTQREAETLNDEIRDPRLKRLATNPLLLTLLALLYCTDGHLPRLRVDLYRNCVRTLTETWRRTRLREEEVLDVLGPLAEWIHIYQPTGLATETEVRAQITQSLAAWRGLDLEKLPGSFKRDVSDFLDVVRRESGLLLARGEGLYSFAHLTFQEYFVARHLCVNPEAATEKIVSHMGQARWREPLLLGIAYLSRELPSAVEATFEAVLSAQTPYDALLHRNLLFAAAAVPECASVPMSVARKIASGLVATYGGANRSLRREIANVVRLWGDTHYADVIDDILIEAMRSEDSARRGAAVGLAKEASWASPPVTRVLVQRMPHDGVEGELFYRTLVRLAEIAPNSFPADLLPFRQACLDDAPLRTVVVANRALHNLVKVLYDNRISVARPEFIAMDSSITPYLLQSLRQSGEGEPGSRAERALIALRHSLQGVLNAPTPDRLFVDAVRASLLILDHSVPLYLSQALRIRPALGLQAVMEALRDATRVLTRSWGSDEDSADIDYGRLDADAARLMARLILAATDLLAVLEQSGETWAPVLSWLRSSLSVLVGAHAAAALTPPPEDGVDIADFFKRNILGAIENGLKGGGLHFRNSAAKGVMDNLQPALTEKSVSPRELVSHLSPIGTYAATPQGLSFIKLLLRSDQLGAQDAAVSMIAQMRGFTDLYGLDDATKNSVAKALSDLLSLGIPQIAEHAALLLGEFGLFDELMLMQLVEALRSEDDTIRHRAQHVLSKERRASELSLMTLKALGEISLANDSNGFEWVKIANCMNAVDYDSEQFLSSLVNEAGRCSEAERPAYKRVLSHVWHLSREATRAFCAGLSDGSNTAVQISLAESSKRLLELRLLEDSQQNEIIAALLPLVTRPIDDEVQCAATKAIGLAPVAIQPIIEALLALLRGDRVGSAEQGSASATKSAALISLGRLASRCNGNELVDRLVATLHAYLRGPEPELADAARSALARRIQTCAGAGGMAAIAAAIPERTQFLRALLESGADDDSWDGAEVNGQGYHSCVAKNVCSLIQAEAGLLSDLVSELESAAAWPKRRICLAALAAVAERNPALFNTVLDPALVEEMLVRYGRDAYSFNIRRMSLNALSYLRRVGPGIVPLLLESCRDEESVQRDAIAAARRFRQVDPAVLPELADALHNPSNRVCYVVAQLLGEIGSSRQAMEEEELRAAIAEALAKALGDPSSDREVYGPTPSYSWDSIGVLSEALYDALARVTGAV